MTTMTTSRFNDDTLAEMLADELLNVWPYGGIVYLPSIRRAERNVIADIALVDSLSALAVTFTNDTRRRATFLYYNKLGSNS